MAEAWRPGSGRDPAMSSSARAHPTLSERFRWLIPCFDAGPAPLYAHLAERAAAQLERPARNAFGDVLMPWTDEPPRHLLPLRLFAVVHRWVLAGELPRLVSFYPSAGGTRSTEGAWPPFRAAVIERAELLPELLAPPLQRNEPGRAAALAVGMLLIARETGMPLRLLEVGTSAGLLLRWDRCRTMWWFGGMFESGAPPSGDVEIAERRGCDLFPIDPTTAESEVRLKSFVWADLTRHVCLLDDVIAVCRRVPATVEKADGSEWLAAQLVKPRPGVATVVFHSQMRASSLPSSLEAIADTLARAGAAATPEAPLAYLRSEAADDVSSAPQSRVETRLTMWPGSPAGHDRLLATSDINGRHVRCLNSDSVRSYDTPTPAMS